MVQFIDLEFSQAMFGVKSLGKGRLIGRDDVIFNVKVVNVGVKYLLIQFREVKEQTNGNGKQWNRVFIIATPLD